MNNKYERIFKNYYIDIYKLSYNYTNNKQDAEDVLEDVFYKLFIHKHILNREESEIKKWLVRVCINQLRDLNRKRRNKTTYELDENLPLIKVEDNDVKDILRTLPVNYKNTLYLYYYMGYDIKEISKISEKSESAIKMQLSRGRELLKERMEKYYE